MKLTGLSHSTAGRYGRASADFMHFSLCPTTC
jgi:hypothetical protein